MGSIFGPVFEFSLYCQPEGCLPVAVETDCTATSAPLQ